MDRSHEYLEHRDDWDDFPTPHRPATALEALMSADFGEEPEESTEERNERRQRLRTILEDAMTVLSDIEREVVIASVIEGRSLRELAKTIEPPDRGRYGKTWIAHIRDIALDKLRDVLSKPEMLQALQQAQTGSADPMSESITEEERELVERIEAIHNQGYDLNLTPFRLALLEMTFFAVHPDRKERYEAEWLDQVELLVTQAEIELEKRQGPEAA